MLTGLKIVPETTAIRCCRRQSMSTRVKLLKAKFHYAMQVADLVADLVCDLVADL